MFFINDFLMRIKSVIGEILIKLVLKTKVNATCIALGLFLLSRPLSRNKKYKVLAIVKDISFEDIKALNDNGKDIQYICISIGVFKWIYKAILGPQFININVLNYDEHYLKNKDLKKYENLMMRSIKLFNKLSNIDAVITCNFTYVYLREVANIYLKLKIPYLILYREGIVLHERKEQALDFWKKNFFNSQARATKIFTYNKTVSFILSNLLEEYDNENITITGSPRFDYYRNLNKKNNHKKKLTFFAFNPIDSFFYFDELVDNFDSDLGENIRNETLLVCQHIKDFAKKNKNVDVVIKFKPFAKHREGFLEDISRFFYQGEFENIKITSKKSTKELILSSSATIAFNSTTIIESLIADVPVMTPDFRKYFPDKKTNFLEAYPEICHYVSSVDAIEELIFGDGIEIRRKKIMSDKFIENYSGTSKETFSTKIVEKNIINTITAL